MGALFKKIYVNPSHPGSFQGANKLHKAIKDEGKYTIPLSKVKRWLQNQESFSLTNHYVDLFVISKLLLED